jgi:hypothetical protein
MGMGLILCAVMFSMMAGLVLIESAPRWKNGETGIKVGDTGAALVITAFIGGMIASILWALARLWA